MNSIRLLVVEDDPQDIGTCRSTVERYRDEKQREVELVECKDVDEAFEKLDNTFDGAIIDIRLGEEGDEGNEIVQRIKESQYRFPVAILTGTLGSADPEFLYIGVFKKGDPGAGYDDLLDRFWRIHDTGLTRILGGRGIIESRFGEVFWRNILPEIEKWEVYGQADSTRTENALLRYTLNHLIQLIDEDIERYFPEEFYLFPPLSENLRTGGILNDKDSDQRFAVMTPECDLIVREGSGRNTDRILLVEIISPKELFDWYGCQALSTLSQNRRNTFVKALENNWRTYYHCLPETDFFSLSFLNFRKVSTVGVDDIEGKFDLPTKVQISPPFIKDIVVQGHCCAFFVVLCSSGSTEYSLLRPCQVLILQTWNSSSMDVHSPEKRSFNMSRIKGKDTAPEMLIRRWLWTNGYRYRLHREALAGKPDIVLPRYRAAIFVHGCFWHRHGCQATTTPMTRPNFWTAKFQENVNRDKRNIEDLLNGGWRVMVIWECSLRGKTADLEQIGRQTSENLKSDICFAESMPGTS